jgi:hypothetical protein
MCGELEDKRVRVYTMDEVFYIEIRKRGARRRSPVGSFLVCGDSRVLWVPGRKKRGDMVGVDVQCGYL